MSQSGTMQQSDSCLPRDMRGYLQVIGNQGWKYSLTLESLELGVRLI